MRTRWQVRTAAAVVVAALSAVGGVAPALAQPRGGVTEAAKSAAREHYKAGEARFAEGNYAAALPLYEQAEAIIPIWQTKYKIALCRDRLGQPAAAVRWYQTFLEAARDANPSEKLAVAVADAKGRLAAISGPPPSQTGQVRVSIVPANAPRLMVVVDNNPAQQGAAVSVSPGHHRIVAQADGFSPAAAEIDVAPGEAKEIRIALSPAAGQVPGVIQPGVPLGPDQTVSTRRSNVPSYVLFGLTGVGVAVGAAFGVVALNDKSSFNANPTFSGADKEKRDALIADVAFGTAIVCAVTGVVLLVTNRGPAPNSALHTFVSPYAGPTGGGAVGGFTF